MVDSREVGLLVLVSTEVVPLMMVRGNLGVQRFLRLEVEGEDFPIGGYRYKTQGDSLLLLVSEEDG